LWKIPQTSHTNIAVTDEVVNGYAEKPIRWVGEKPA
jgi:hypothetical protein